MKNFADRVIKSIYDNMSYLCVGLDPQFKYFPPHILQFCAQKYGVGLEACGRAIVMFYTTIIDVSNEYCMAYKPQMAFYEKYGEWGIWAFQQVVAYARLTGKIIVEDAKREDGDDTAKAYAEGHLGKIDIFNETGELVLIPNIYSADALTVTPWIEEPNFKPFLEAAAEEKKGVFIVDRTSFKPTSTLQEMVGESGDKGWVVLAKKVAELGKQDIGENGYSSIGVVMGATYPEDAAIMKEVLPMAFKLIPGFGAQGGKADEAVVCVNDDGFGIFPNNSRATNYAWNPKFKSEFACDPKQYAMAAAKACEQSRDALNDAVKRRIGKLPW